MYSQTRAATLPAPRHSNIRRTVLAALAAISLAAVSSPVRAQVPVRAFELRPFVGGNLPTGDQRDFLKDALLVGAQASWHFTPALALTSTFAWSPSKDRITSGDQTIDVFQYDIGAEARAASWFKGAGLDLSPFVGLGVGGRTYSYRDLDVDTKSNFDGYGALGGDIGFGRAALRLEVRDYVSGFKPLVGAGESTTRNDIALAAGLTVRF